MKKYSIFILLISSLTFGMAACKKGKNTSEPIAKKNNPPTIPTNPSPADNSTEIALLSNISWNCSDPDGDALSYDVYLGRNNNPGKVASNIITTTYQTPVLNNNATYYWKIVAKDSYGNVRTSPIWSFKTQASNNEIIEKKFTLGNSGDSITMIWISPGEFMMGAQANENGAQGDEYPRHQVWISKGFWIGKYEITQQQWEAVVGSWNFYFDNNPNRPAEMVSWNQVQSSFINKINNNSSKNPWRLPSAAEWEYACRAGQDETRFWWGNDPGYSLITDYAWYWNNNDHETHDVGMKIPNPWGLYDMNGNVWEWCEDTYHSNYNGAPTNGSAWTDSPQNGRIARGGGWGQYGAQFCRSSARGRDNPAYGYNIFGFRLVRNED